MPLSSTDLDSLKERCRVPLLEPDQEVLQKEGLEALNLVIEDFLTLADQPVGRDATRSEMEALLREALPEKSTDFSSVLEEFRERVKPFAFRTNHPRFLAFVPAAPTFYSILGELLCAGHNFFSGVWVEAAGPSQVEIQVLDWFKEIVGYPSEAQGVLTSGGSEANLTALVVAR